MTLSWNLAGRCHDAVPGTSTDIHKTTARYAKQGQEEEDFFKSQDKAA